MCLGKHIIVSIVVPIVFIVIIITVCIMYVRYRRRRAFYAAAPQHPVHLQTFPAAGEAFLISIAVPKCKQFGSWGIK